MEKGDWFVYLLTFFEREIFGPGSRLPDVVIDMLIYSIAKDVSIFTPSPPGVWVEELELIINGWLTTMLILCKM